MRANRIFSLLITAVLLLSVFSACNSDGGQLTNDDEQSAIENGQSVIEDENTALPEDSAYQEEPETEPSPENMTTPSDSPDSSNSSDSPEQENTAPPEQDAVAVTPSGTSAPAVTAAPKPQSGTAAPVANTPPSPSGGTSVGTGTASTGNVTITAAFTPGNTWSDGGKTVVQYSGAVKNTGSAACSSWSVTVTVPSDAEMVGGWNGIFSISGTTLTIKNESYNGQIPAGGSTEIGFQIKSANTLSLGSGTGSGGTSGGGGSSGGTTGGGNSGGTQTGTVGNNNPAVIQVKDVPPPTSTDWLYAKGNQIVNNYGQPVWITGINWFGYNTGTNTFDGLWAACLNTSLAEIANRGFNMLRIPISTELLKQWSNGEYPRANFNQAINHYLVGMNSLEIFDYVIGQCRANGIKIMIDIHSAKTDPMGHMQNMWFHADITEKDFIDTLAWIARRYAHDDTILAYDLKNEPHGKPNETPRAKWDNSTDSDNWKHVAEKAAMAVLTENPNALILVEGIEIYPRDIVRNPNFTSTNSADYYFNWWGGNLRGVRDNPINLGRFQNKLVYSPHDYGPTVYEQPWFRGNFTFDSLMKDCWRDNWFFIHEENIAPLLIGEWGGFMDNQRNLTWKTHLRTLIKDNRLHHTYWCFNQNSGDTGGLILSDWMTWDETRYNFVREVLWQQGGKFVGLDSQIPLGNNGISLSQVR
ncbi:MAG: cellulase family glycosylhydrolase [Oscillospiraceae bacterium]|jgi:aryl-phospho-beta-D-glucosidase BglC (GH1 family)|nr:cellulase family glycosylhydrolase [Oscillospiraceae bacterium]